MASRKEQKARAREERLARERAAAVSEKRRRRRTSVGWGVAALLVAAGIAVPLAAGGGDGSGKQSVGLQTGAPPWPPETDNLQERLDALDFPQGQGEAFHLHSVLRVFADGRQVEVPPNIGIDQARQVHSGLHTHEPDGKMHVESPAAYDFTLGQFFTVWGVEFTPTRLGGLIASGNKALQVFVNGERETDPVDYVLKPRDKIVVAYGPPGQAPKSFDYEFQPGE